MKTRAILLLLLILICSTQVSAELVKVTCTCNCRGETLTSMGTYPKKYLEIEQTEIENAEKECHKNCASTCGGYSDCSAPCPDCCSDYCTSQYIDSKDEYENKCRESCQSTCGFREAINGLADIIYYVAGIMAAIMLIVQGYRLITSSNAEDRSDAKKGIFYVILALVIIIAARSLVNLLFSV